MNSRKIESISKKLLSIITVLIVLYKVLFSSMAIGASNSRDKTLEIYAHRGFTGLYPETTMWGYEESLKLGVDSLDIDVALTKDDIVVGSHDPYLNRAFTRDNTGKFLTHNNIKIIDLTFAELALYDIGKLNPRSKYSKRFPLQASRDNERIPSLEQVINLIKTKGDKQTLQIEIKTKPNRDSEQHIERFVTAIIKTLEKNDFIERAELQSFDWRTLLYAKKINKKAKLSFITEQSVNLNTFRGGWTAGYELKNHEYSVIKTLVAAGADTWCPYYKNVTKELVQQAHQNNIRVVPWTADTEKHMIDLIQAGVDGIITNRPDILRRVMTDMNLPLPKKISIA